MELNNYKHGEASVVFVGSDEIGALNLSLFNNYMRRGSSGLFDQMKQALHDRLTRAGREKASTRQGVMILTDTALASCRDETDTTQRLRLNSLQTELAIAEILEHEASILEAHSDSGGRDMTNIHEGEQIVLDAAYKIRGFKYMAPNVN